jgi:hypothetical protein
VSVIGSTCFNQVFRAGGESLAELPTGTVAFLFTDLERSTRLSEQHPDGMKQSTRAFREEAGVAPDFSPIPRARVEARVVRTGKALEGAVVE